VTNHDGSMKYYLSFFNYCCLFIVFTVLGIKLRALHFSPTPSYPSSFALVMFQVGSLAFVWPARIVILLPLPPK
jgi:hypothetical protein